MRPQLASETNFIARLCRLSSAVAAMIFVLFLAGPALASGSSFGPTCENLFQAQPSVHARLIQFADETATLVRRLHAPPFQLAKFDQALADDRAAGPENLRQPKTREERLAFLHYVSNVYGRNPYDLELWARQATPKELRRLTDAIGRFNVERGFSPSKIDAIFWKLFEFSSPTPNTMGQIGRLTLSKLDRIALEQWSTKELASASALEAFERLGLIKDQGLRGRWMDLVRSHPHAIPNLITGAMMVFETTMLKSPVSAPNYSRLRKAKLDPRLRELIEQKGFDAAYPLLKSRYGHLVQFDRGFFMARRLVTVGLMSFMLIHLYPTVVREALPPNLVRPDADAVQMTKTLVGYYSDLTVAIVSDRLHGTDENEIRVATHFVPPGPPKAVPPVDDHKVSAHRVALTFDQQLSGASSQNPSPATTEDQTASKGQATPVDKDVNDKTIGDNLKYLNTLNFSDPTNH